MIEAIPLLGIPFGIAALAYFTLNLVDMWRGKPVTPLQIILAQMGTITTAKARKRAARRNCDGNSVATGDADKA